MFCTLRRTAQGPQGALTHRCSCARLPTHTQVHTLMHTPHIPHTQMHALTPHSHIPTNTHHIPHTLHTTHTHTSHFPGQEGEEQLSRRIPGSLCSVGGKEGFCTSLHLKGSCGHTNGEALFATLRLCTLCPGHSGPLRAQALGAIVTPVP
jgi:hypothetical protein